MINCIRMMSPEDLVAARMEAIRLLAGATLEAIDRELERRGLNENGQLAQERAA